MEMTVLEHVAISHDYAHKEKIENDDGTSSDIVVFDKDTTKLELVIERDKKECINQRHYKNYTEEMIEKDFKEFEFVLIELVDYDLEQNGASFSEKVSENGITREWIKRESILKKIPTLCHIT
jgi:hypothetical protein|uniref:Uncharacterized protein n=1 Tax=Siphoviridae sp. ctnMb19 TaxID=2825659 RepID=A0A8S5NTG6_9CAUD|nr:MAG TPA: hypothetical protein [Siphoviridae sp. ctnMb19]